MSETEVKVSTLRSRAFRARTGNVYDRAYASAGRRVVRVFQHEHPDEWAAILAEELVRGRHAPAPDA